MAASCCLAVTPRQLEPVPDDTVVLLAHYAMGENFVHVINSAQVCHVFVIAESFSH